MYEGRKAACASPSHRNNALTVPQITSERRALQTLDIFSLPKSVMKLVQIFNR